MQDVLLLSTYLTWNRQRIEYNGNETSEKITTTDNSLRGLGENRVIFIDSEGEIQFNYEKTKLVPGLEDEEYIAGNGIIPNVSIELSNGNQVKLAAVICMDSNYVGYIRDGVKSDTEILLAPSWDWKPIDDYHNRWVIYRSVENGFSTTRSTYDGYTTAIDPYGRVLMTSHTDNTGYENVVFSDVPIMRVHTLYSKIGFVIDWCYLLGLVLVVVGGIVSKGIRRRLMNARARR